MKKIIFKVAICILSALIIFSPSVGASGGSDSAGREVVFGYREALDMVLRDGLHGVNVQIHVAQTQHRDLQESLAGLERGGAGRDAFDAMAAELAELDVRLAAASQAHGEIMDEVESALMGLLSGIGAAGRDGADEFLNQAVQLAVFGMISAREMSDNIAAMESRRAQAQNEIWNFQGGASPQAGLNDARRGLSDADGQIRHLRLQLEQTKLSLENSLRTVMLALWEQDILIKTLEAEITHAEESLRLMNIRYNMGLVSTNDMRGAETALAGQQERVEGIIRARSGIVRNLNLMLGEPLSQATVIEYERDLPELPENLERYFILLTETAPTLRQLELSVETSEAARRIVTGNNRDIRVTEQDRRRAEAGTGSEESIRNLRTRIALQDAVDQNTRNLNQGRRAMEAAVLRGLDDLYNLTSRRYVLEENLIRARETLENTQRSLENGRATPFELNRARLDILQIEQELESNLNQQWALIFRLNNPSLL